MSTPSPALPYQCPGEKHPISQAVHLARLAEFYPACRECRHRAETASLSTRQVEQLANDLKRGLRQSLFDRETAGGVFPNQFSRRDAEHLATALGIYLRRNQQAEPSVVVAADGRPLTAELLAAVAEGLRFAGCKVIDIGFASAPCVAFAIDHLPADGGLLIGNHNGQARDVNLKFWQADARPMSGGGELDRLQAILGAGINRPVRSFGAMRRFRADVPYLACLHKYFHAMRPLRLLLDTASQPVKKYLQQLSGQVACEIIELGRQTDNDVPAEAATQRLAHALLDADAHFGIWIDGDGESCRLVDQRGEPLATERVLHIILSFLLEEHPGATFVLEEECSSQLAQSLAEDGAVIQHAQATRETMDRQMRDSQALAGGGPSGRIWYRDHQPSADALKTLTLLLTILSRSDRDLSEVVAS